MLSKFSPIFWALSTFTISVCSSVPTDDQYQWDNRFYLATYPRSGNGWTRFLIEEATNIVTSTVYPDFNTLEKVFPWGGYCLDTSFMNHRRCPEKDETILIKTHYPAICKTMFDNRPYIGVLRIIRHPVDSFYSWYVYNQNQAHKPIKKKIPRNVLISYIDLWKKFQDYWDNQENVLTLRYEDLYQTPFESLKLILFYLGYTVNDDDVQRAILLYPPKGGILKHTHHFTDDDLKLIETELKERMNRYGYSINEVQAA